MFKKVNKNLIFVILLISFFFLIGGCSVVQESSASRSSEEKPLQIIGIPPQNIPQNAITEYYIDDDVYIKELKITLNSESCEDGWEEKSDVLGFKGSDTALLCAKYNEDDEDSEEDTDLNFIPRNSINEYYIAANTYIEDVELMEAEEDCEEGWIERTNFTVEFGGGGCDNPITKSFKLCVKYNGDESDPGSLNLPQNSITEFHLENDLMWEDIAVIEGDNCANYGSGWENDEDFFIGTAEVCKGGISFLGIGGSCKTVNLGEDVDFSLCIDKTDEDIDENVEIVWDLMNINKQVLEDSGISAQGYCQANLESDCVSVSCINYLADIGFCTGEISCDFRGYESVNDEVELEIICGDLSEITSDLPEEVGRMFIEQELEDGRSISAILEELGVVCNTVGELEGWSDEEVQRCVAAGEEKAAELDTGMTPLIPGRPGEAFASPTQECTEYGLEHNIPVDGCSGCCIRPTGIPGCCDLSLGQSQSCSGRIHEFIDHNILGKIALEYKHDGSYYAWINTEIDPESNVIIGGYKRQATRIGDSDTFMFTDLEGRSWSIDSGLAADCSAVSGTISARPIERCQVKTNELLGPYDSIRISCNPGFAIAGVIMNDFESELPSKDSVSALCCPLESRFVG